MLILLCVYAITVYAITVYAIAVYAINPVAPLSVFLKYAREQDDSSNIFEIVELSLGLPTAAIT